MIAAYTFGESSQADVALDATGKSPAGLVEGTAKREATEKGPAFVFDGKTRITTPDTTLGLDATQAFSAAVWVRFDGPLFFGAAHRFLIEVAEVSDVRVVILRLSRITTIDATGATVLADTIATLEARGITVLLSGIRDEHHNVFRVLGIYDRLAHEGHVFATTPEAIAHARRHLARGDHHAAGTGA